MNKNKILLFWIVANMVVINISATNSVDIFDAVSILEYLSGEKDLTNITHFDMNCDCVINLKDAFLIVEDQINACNNTCNNTPEILKKENLISSISNTNKKIKNYTYNGNFTGNATGNVNGTANGNYTIILTLAFSTPFNATFDLTSNGTYKGNYDRNNRTGNFNATINSHVNGTATANTPFGYISQSFDETNTTELSNTSDIDIYNKSVEVLTNNKTNITFLPDEYVNNIICYKILVVPDKNESIEMIKNSMKNLMENLNLSEINLNLTESNIKDANVTYWISKENFSIVQEQLNAEIENFTQQINKTIEVNKCKDTNNGKVCIKNVTVDTLNIKQMNITAFIRFNNFTF